MNKNETITLNIDNLTSAGAGVGRYDGMAVFVDGALPGETINALVIKVAKNYAVGRLLEIVKPSKDRTEPLCPYYRRCGGCSMQHLAYAKQLEYKRNEAQQTLMRIGHCDIEVEPCIGMDFPYRYRNKAQIPVGVDKAGNAVLGFYAQRTHNVVPMSDCLLQSEPQEQYIKVIKELITYTKTPVYNEMTGKGCLRHFAMRRAQSGDIMLILVTNTMLNKPEVWIKKLSELPNVVSIVQNHNSEKGNIIFSNDFRVLWGKSTLSDTLCGIDFELSPNSFLQVNHTQAEKLYGLALEMVDLHGDETVLDAYCGIGIMTQLFAKRAKLAIGVEIVKEAVENAITCAAKNNSNAEFICGDCATELPELVKRIDGCDCLVLDPPRAGCEGDMVRNIGEANINRIVYISCDTATQARDIAQLAGYGYKAVRAACVDMFCQTGHVETVVLLQRRNATHCMKLNPEPFDMIKSGEKTIELRLYDEKRQRIKPGDVIVFMQTVTGERLTVGVKKLHLFDSFETLYQCLPLTKCGYTEETVNDADSADMLKYYSTDEQKKYGVVGIELCTL